jgi:pimeloyl-ACP methyl ester carboxylesterase
LSVAAVLSMLPIFGVFGHTQTNTVKPSIVLVHGAWADASSWSRVIKILQEQGFTVYAPPNTLRGVSADSAYLTSFLATIPGPIVLVGHSYGGVVISNAATGNPNVKALVYVDAFVPEQGEAVGALLAIPPPPGQASGCLDPATSFNIVPFSGGLDTYIKQSVYPTCFANTVPTPLANEMAAGQRPLALNVLTDPSGAPAWKTIRSFYVLGTLDRVIPPYLQLFMANRANSTITEVAGPHPSMVTQPDAVARVIEQASGQSTSQENEQAPMIGTD